MWIWLLIVGIAGALILLRELAASAVFRLYTRPIRLRNNETPLDYGLSFDELSFVSGNVQHAAWLIHPPDIPGDAPLPAVLMPHGFAANRADILPRCAAIARAGMCAFTFDWRGHGDSGDSLCSGGLVEVDDLKTALVFMRSLDNVDSDRVAIYGFSMGATISLLVAADEYELRCIVADSPYYGLGEIMEHVLARLPVPRGIMRAPMRRRFRNTFRYEYNAFDVPGAVQRIPHDHLLLLGGTADRIVPFDHVKRLYEAGGSKARFHITDGGGHFDNADPATLSSIIIPFLKTHLELDEPA